MEEDNQVKVKNGNKLRMQTAERFNLFKKEAAEKQEERKHTRIHSAGSREGGRTGGYLWCGGELGKGEVRAAAHKKDLSLAIAIKTSTSKREALSTSEGTKPAAATNPIKQEEQVNKHKISEENESAQGVKFGSLKKRSDMLIHRPE